MTSGWHYNNFGVEALGIAFVLGHSVELPVSKTLLIAPIISHNGMLSHLANGNTNLQSFERYIIENISKFSNFNQRYYDSLIGSVNAVQLLSELHIVDVDGEIIKLQANISYSAEMGTRAKKILKASQNISKILQTPSEILYLNLRIEL